MRALSVLGLALSGLGTVSAHIDNHQSPLLYADDHTPYPTQRIAIIGM